MKWQYEKPIVIKVSETVTAKDPSTGDVQQVSLHKRIGPWTLMAVIERGFPESVAVFEDLKRSTGPIVFMTQKGLLLELSKTLEPTRVPEEDCYRGHAKAKIVDVDRDILREEFLALGRDPTFEEITACFPPIRRVRYCKRYEGPHTFVGSRASSDTVPVYYTPLHGAPRVNPLIVAPEIRAVIEEERLWEGLVGGWLPAVRLSYPVREGLTWDLAMFGIVDPPTTFIQPVWYRFLRLEDGKITEAHYVDSYLPYPCDGETDPEGFYIALYKLHAYWAGIFESAMRLDIPQGWIMNFCRHAMVQEMITRVGDHPRYGIIDRDYGSSDHDGLQDTLNSTVNCYLEWGLFDKARGYLDYYLTHFLRPNGTIAYRGPEIGQYARMLTVLAQYYSYTGDDQHLLKHDHKIKAIVDMLMMRRERAKKHSRHDPAYGMIAGRHEADISFETPSLATLNYEQPYFSNSTEAWRGLRDLGRAWAAIGGKHGDGDLILRGETLEKEAEALRQDIDRAIERSILDDSGMPYLPSIAGSKFRHIDAPYRSRPEAFDDNRVWCEMMHSGMITKDIAELILAYASAHKGTTLGIFGNRSKVVAFQCYGEAYGLIQHDMIHEFLMLYYAHVAHLHTRGTWSVFECVDIDRDRAEHLPYCVPAQMTVPIITKWMLVFEDPLANALWLAKATPRSWLEDGKRIHVEYAPTCWGVVSYEIESRLGADEVRARIWLPKPMTTEVNLRLRVPERYNIQNVTINGLPWHAIRSDGETITLPADVAEPINLAIRYRRAGSS